MNINLVGGDPYGGFCGSTSSSSGAPSSGSVNHATEVANLWHIGASTHPGPGLGGGSGFLLAKRLGVMAEDLAPEGRAPSALGEIGLSISRPT
jgi:phytoene dehydrogenase-like protein